MIVFHEGLPRSGKSYEACVYQIIPALLEGRQVLTNIDGINYDKFSELTKIPASWLKEKLICVFDPDHDVMRQAIYDQAGKDMLLVIDEIQDLFPSERQKLSPEWMTFITQHGHEGQDIVLMGQDRKDCHNIWRRRIQRVFTFNKLSAVGRPKQYKWDCYEATRPEKYKHVSGGIRTYEKKYFGLYKSHTDGTNNTSNFTDDRSNVFKNKNLRFAAIAVVVIAYFAVTYLVDFFRPATPISEVSASMATPGQQSSFQPEQPQEVVIEQPEPVDPDANSFPGEELLVVQGIDYLDTQARRYKLRLAGILRKPSGEMSFLIEVRDTTKHLVEQFNYEEVVSMGWFPIYRDHGLELVKGDVKHLVRPWPLDTNYGQIDRRTLEML